MRKLIPCIWCWIFLAMAQAVAWAQMPDSPGPPPEQRPGGDVYIPWAVAIVLLVIVCFGALKGAGRTHQD
jgi:hypothetical protein